MDVVAIIAIIATVFGIIAALHQIFIGQSVREWMTQYRRKKIESAGTTPTDGPESRKSLIQETPGDPLKQLIMLPRRSAGFVDREEEIEEIIAGLKSFKAVQLRGLGGIGKTELAVEVAYRVKELFPDGVIWLFALDYTLEDILNAIANAFDIPAGQVPLKEKKLVIQKELLTKRLLLIFDNVEQVEPIEDMLNILPRCAVLITSRPPYFISKASLIDIGPIPEEGAVKLFELDSGRDLSDRERILARDICRRLGAFPLAIELAAKHVQISKVDIERLLDRVEKAALDALEERFINDRSVRASLLSTYQLLSEPDKSLFATLGTIGGRSFNLNAVEAVSEDKDAEKRLERLVALSLVKVENNRYSLHPLIKLFARENLTSLAPYKRMAEYFADYAVAHSRDFTALEIERVNVQEALDWSFKHGEKQLVIKIAQALLGEDAYYGFLAQRGYWNDALVRIEQAIEASAELSDVSTEACLYLALGLFNYWLGNNDDARIAYKSAQQKFEEIGDGEGLVRAYWQQGYIEDDEDNYAKADNLYRKSLSLSLKLDNEKLVSTSRELVGVVEYHRGNYEQARAHLEQSLEESISHGDIAAIARVQRRLAAVARRQAACAPQPQSRMYVEEARRLLADSLKVEKNERSIARLLRQFGMLEQFLGNYYQAKDYFARSLEIFRKLGNRKGIAAALYNLGTVLEAEGDLQQAKQLYNESLSIAQEINVRLGLALNKLRLGAISQKLGNSDRALKFTTEAIEILAAIESPYLDPARKLLEAIQTN